MFSSNNDRILRLRNDISLRLDDLVALVVNSSLASDLRSFSSEIMELTPGFTFDLDQAKELDELTKKTLKQYQEHAIGDVDLMNYFSNARSLLKGKELESGGKKMDFKSLFNRKERKMQESRNELERQYKEVSDQILRYEEEKARSIEAAKGHSPDSKVYRDSERAYNHAKNELMMLRKQEADLARALETAGRIELVKKFKEQEKLIAKHTEIVLGDKKGQEQALAEMEIYSDRISSVLSSTSDFGDEVFKKASEAAFVSKTDSEFGAEVAANERRQATVDSDGAFARELQEQAAGEKSEFDGQLSAQRDKE